MIKNLIADVPLGSIQGVSGPLSNPGKNGAPDLFTSTLSKIIGVITVVGFIWFTFTMVLGAIGILASGGDKGGVEKARKQITTGIIGIVVLIAAIFIVSLIGQILGLKSILNPVCIIGNSC